MDILDFLNNLNVFSLQNVSLIAGLLFIFYLIKEKRVAWFFAFISSSILIYIYFAEDVYMQALLYCYYTLMSIYGFITWSKKNKEKKKLSIIAEYPVKNHLIVIFVTFLLSGSIATFLSIVVHSAYSTLDAVIFGFSIVATYMQVHKIVSNWLYWCIIDALSIILSLYLSLYSVALLMLLYIVLAIWGYKKWKKQLIKINSKNKQ